MRKPSLQWPRCKNVAVISRTLLGCKGCAAGLGDFESISGLVSASGCSQVPDQELWNMLESFIGCDARVSSKDVTRCDVARGHDIT